MPDQLELLVLSNKSLNSKCMTGKYGTAMSSRLHSEMGEEGERDYHYNNPFLLFHTERCNFQFFTLPAGEKVVAKRTRLELPKALSSTL